MSIEDTLGDFLYTVEPPEDDQESRNLDGPVVRRLIDEVSRVEEDPPKTAGHLASVKAWLEDLACHVEEEGHVSLQSKSLPKRRPSKRSSKDSFDLKNLTSSSTSAVTKLLLKADKFDEHYDVVCE